MRRIIVLLFVTLSLVVPVSAGDLGNASDRFNLWNRCDPMPLHIFVSEDATDIGVTEEIVTIAVRSRLRAARLYLPEPEPWDWEKNPQMPLAELTRNLAHTLSGLTVEILVAGSVFVLKLEYHKAVTDEASEVRGFVATWTDGTFGTHGRDSDFILARMSEKMDVFIDESLRVNASAC